MTAGQDKGVTRQGQDAHDRLVEAIRAGELKPGARLIETELAKRLGISRTPIREAIRQLESDGLVSHQPRSGATVRRLDYAEITELYEMRSVLEGTAARFAARAASEIELSELATINDEMRAGRDTAQLYEANRQFHRVLLNAARNRFLVKSVDSLQKTMLILGPSTMEEGDRAERAMEEHAALLDALRARDGDRAEASMRAHIEAAHRARLRQLRTGDAT
ncbi:GntR family transcriptional regulator [Pseudoponticoccus marisrubri]|uniref:GntR family transcriptional regulator n=1 Tax=Pseudoponticoccus marisrubri TaxID=1685382 RepID=A0A0W7WKK0_9RHOB|nr:GntR family transcriptional regulator [Pseudoponticoccus marisrubri]KUF11139.1 GntR family transcriptional regulator [Pseudoponticoccus marisrubri]